MKRSYAIYTWCAVMAAAAVCTGVANGTAAVSLPQYAAQQTERQRVNTEKKWPDNWEAGKAVSQAMLKGCDLSKCFSSEPVPDCVFSRMNGKSFGKGCNVARSSLRYVRVLHWDGNGTVRMGELVCHKSIAADLVDIFRNLFDAKYPIERMVLIDDYGADDIRSMEANNTSCFNFRFVAGTRVPSNHSYGKAIDVNPLYNPYVKKRSGGKTTVSPPGGKQYADRSKDFRYKIDRSDLLYKEFRKHGFTWGGDWQRAKDYQHFEKK